MRPTTLVPPFNSSKFFFWEYDNADIFNVFAWLICWNPFYRFELPVIVFFPVNLVLVNNFRMRNLIFFQNYTGVQCDPMWPNAPLTVDKVASWGCNQLSHRPELAPRFPTTQMSELLKVFLFVRPRCDPICAYRLMLFRPTNVLLLNGITLYNMFSKFHCLKMNPHSAN